MGLDIRLPIGMMFSLVGALLAIQGLVTRGSPEMYGRSLGLNVNLGWGIFLLVFGLLMLTFGWRGQKTDQPKPQD